MNEDFLHYLWKYKLFSKLGLRTSENEVLTILKSGLHNKNAGPDFLNAQLKIGNQTWAGNVEIHVKASDWYLHNHETDANYDAVILHVVWENDAVIYMENNQSLPTLVLKDFVEEQVLNNYRNLFLTPTSWIACQSSIANVNDFTIDHWKERLFFERLERKSTEIKILLEKENNNFEAVLFQLLVKNFGLKVNGDAFLRLAQSVDFSIVQKVSSDENQFSALLFGQAGFLEEAVEDAYYQQLKAAYHYLKHKFKLEAVSKNHFSFFRMRPNNFPTIRIAQLVSLFHQHQHLFSKLIDLKNLKDFYDLFSIEMHPFWKTHYNFEATSKFSSKKLTKSFVDLLIINTIIPLKFLYQKSRGAVDEESFLEILKKLKPEKNSVISKFAEFGVSAKNAFETQALLELKNNYCAPKRCLECAIGVAILNR
ncbi:DUF2851 family protein [Polaribacter batillariae]|uniref:DUF2851 family protein n=2 Tax=Polaribacter batillariae TaxID=2808900 RepID=A0ABX7T348_9FLAO|nr:DUF2851 family protein [Polaribacter batillariae]QTD39374.1 DUF2851 family protein [Polaribacter batillariae]